MNKNYLRGRKHGYDTAERFMRCQVMELQGLLKGMDEALTVHWEAIVEARKVAGMFNVPAADDTAKLLKAAIAFGKVDIKHRDNELANRPSCQQDSDRYHSEYLTLKAICVELAKAEGDNP